MGKTIDDPEWTARDCAEYTYDDRLTVHATSAEDALKTIRQHGFLITDPKKLKRTGKTLAEYLAADQTEKEEIR